MPCGKRPLAWQQDRGGLGHPGDLPCAGQIPNSPESFFPLTYFAHTDHKQNVCVENSVSLNSCRFRPEKSLPLGFVYLFTVISGGWESQSQSCAQHTDLNSFQRSSRRGRWSDGFPNHQNPELSPLNTPSPAVAQLCAPAFTIVSVSSLAAAPAPEVAPMNQDPLSAALTWIRPTGGF